jgi:copper chaperone CopZ
LTLVAGAGAATTETVVLRVEGMACPNCETTVERVIGSVDGVVAVDADRRAQTAASLFAPARQRRRRDRGPGPRDVLRRIAVAKRSQCGAAEDAASAESSRGRAVAHRLGGGRRAGQRSRSRPKPTPPRQPDAQRGWPDDLSFNTGVDLPPHWKGIT